MILLGARKDKSGCHDASAMPFVMTHEEAGKGITRGQLRLSTFSFYFSSLFLVCRVDIFI